MRPLMRPMVLGAVLAFGALPLLADARHTVLMDVLGVAELSAILHDEGIRYGDTLDVDFLNGQGGRGWQLQVARIYAPERIAEGIRSGLEAHLKNEILEDSIAFFASDLGARVVMLENNGRVALGDAAVEQQARGRFEDLGETDPRRHDLIMRMIAAGDLVDRNVTSAMNSNLQFLRGMVDGNAYDMTEEDILSQVGADREALEVDTLGWLGGFMVLAYSPLSDAELTQYVEYSESPAGIALNNGLFAGFDPVFEGISYALGRALALNMTGQEL